LRRSFGAYFFLAILVVAAAGAGVLWLRHAMRLPGPLPTATDFVVPREGLDTLSRTLAAAHIVADPLVFRWGERLTRSEGPIHAAEFAFPAGASVDEVLRILRTAKPVLHRVTIPEGLTAIEIAGILADAEAASGPVPHLDEGEFFPDTYEFVRGVPRAGLVALARTRMQRILTEEWQDRDPGLPLTSPEQALTLASMVERETALPAERPLVASVFLNRLRLGMKLESDPTVIFGASNGVGKLDRPISRADLETPTPYNTYLIAGLPPGPIGSPGRAAIHAVLHPAPSEYLYFVANGSGGHNFSATLAEHLVNVAKWRKLGH